MKRGLSIFRARQAPCQRVGIFLYQPLDGVEIASGDGREDVMARPALEQLREHVRWNGRAEARRPPDDLELMRVPDSVDVCARIEERAHRLDPTRARREV